jgi:nitroreductase
MDFFEAVRIRRSVRSYTDERVPEEVMERALDAALLAPNSSNMQTWGFYWVRSPREKSLLVQACMSQGAARTAQELLVVVAEPRRWKENRNEMLRILNENQAPKFALDYYSKLIPFTYGFRWLAPLKWLLFSIAGWFRPMVRRPWSGRDIEEVSIKSAALASENFMLAISAQGFSTCPMEGFDEARVRRLLGLTCADRVVMVISVGRENSARGVWGPQIRFPREKFIKRV